MPPQIIQQQRQHFYEPPASSYTKMTTFQPIQQGSGNLGSPTTNIPFNNIQQQQQMQLQQQHLQFYEKSFQLPPHVQNYNKNMSPQHQRPSPPPHPNANAWHHQHAKSYSNQVVVDPNVAFINNESAG